MNNKIIFHFGFIMALVFGSCSEQKAIYQCIPNKNLTGELKAYVVQIDNAGAIKNPALVLLARGVGAGEGYVKVNETPFALPAIPGASVGPSTGEVKETERVDQYFSGGQNDLLAKIIIPLTGDHLKNGVNHVVFSKTEQTDGFQLYDAIITSVAGKEPRITQMTYRVVTRGDDPSIDDFDFVVNYNGEGKRKESDLPEWAKRGKIRYYRAGINFNHLDRMFEMFDEGHFNLVMLQVSTPHDTTGEEYHRYKAFIDRCHDNNIRVTFDGGAGGQPIRLNSISADSILVHPEMQAWLSRDEYGEPRWRRKGSSYWPDLNNKDYRNRVLKTAELAIYAGVDELYYDWAIGGTKGIVSFFRDVQDLIHRKGKNLTVFGNCKGNMIADDICDINKSEGTEEAGIWEGRWVHNVAQAKFYYAAGDGWKPYRSKYEGADPGAPNPGAYSVVNGMKIGWKRPMAEAKAFQSDFVIAEAGRTMLNGWLEKNDPVAMKAWEDICSYNSFFAQMEYFYTDIISIARVGLLSPPVIPSFETSVKRVQLYDTLIEMNIMYDILLLPKLSPGLLARYDLIIVPDIPWLDTGQLAALREYKEKGGKVYVIGSSKELQDRSTLIAPAYLCHETKKENVRLELLRDLEKLLPNRMITLENSENLLVNMVKKRDTDQVIIHFVNYTDIMNNVRVKLNLEGLFKNYDEKNIRLFSPDEVKEEINSITFEDKQIGFTIPELKIYNMVVIN
jgi:hypothetical protein